MVSKADLVRMEGGSPPLALSNREKTGRRAPSGRRKASTRKSGRIAKRKSGPFAWFFGLFSGRKRT